MKYLGLFLLLSSKLFSSDLNQFEVYVKVISVSTIDSTRYEKNYVSRISKIDMLAIKGTELEYCQLSLFKENLVIPFVTTYGKPRITPLTGKEYIFKIVEKDNVCIIIEVNYCREDFEETHLYSCLKN
jgi:hypothetical protein